MKKNLLEGKKILIVDDEPDVLDTLENSLAMCELLKAFSFRQAKELLETQYFDFVILDIMGVNGYRLLEIANEKKVEVEKVNKGKLVLNLPLFITLHSSRHGYNLSS